tara:strand:+ start:4371 stop:4985 length:615 start_codon:yes stop_codon:yes gene_type:complete
MFKKTTQRTQNRPPVSMPLLFSVKTKIHNTPIINKTQIIENSVKKTIKQQNINETDTNDTMKWGTPIWNFLHCLASNISVSFFQSNRQEVLKVVYLICTNLPCPLCSHHAKGYLDGINFNNITKKQDLERHLYLFHNSVNKRKNFPLFSENQLDKYKQANMKNIINGFVKAYNIPNTLTIHSMSRNHTCNYVKKWLIDNYNHFC